MDWFTGKKCMHIGVNYGAMSQRIWFILGTLVFTHVLYILLNFQITISNSFEVINFLCSYPR